MPCAGGIYPQAAVAVGDALRPDRGDGVRHGVSSPFCSSATICALTTKTKFDFDSLPEGPRKLLRLATGVTVAEDVRPASA